MKTIASLKGADFLRAINQARYAVDALMKKSNVIDLWKRKPALEGKETYEEKIAAQKSQIKSNLSDTFDVLLEKCPQETYDCIMSMCILDEGEEEPDGLEIVATAYRLITDKRVIDFLLQLGKLGLFDTDN